MLINWSNWPEDNVISLHDQRNEFKRGPLLSPSRPGWSRVDEDHACAVRCSIGVGRSAGNVLFLVLSHPARLTYSSETCDKEDPDIDIFLSPYLSSVISRNSTPSTKYWCFFLCETLFKPLYVFLHRFIVTLDSCDRDISYKLTILKLLDESFGR